VNQKENATSISVIGKAVTLTDCVQTVAKALGLLDALGDEVLAPDVVRPDWSCDGVVLFDGDERPATREFVATCSSSCAERVPGFAGCPFPLTFHCRGCSKLVCWAHTGRSEPTGAWCQACATT